MGWFRKTQVDSGGKGTVGKLIIGNWEETVSGGDVGELVTGGVAEAVGMVGDSKKVRKDRR
jgi:hypothetical protein